MGGESATRDLMPAPKTRESLEVAEEVKSLVIPRSAATRNPSFCGGLDQETSLAAHGMTAGLPFPRPL
jgi:hypothetical protein